MSENKIKQIKEELINDLKDANNLNDIIIAIHCQIDDINREYYFADAKPDFERPFQLLMISAGEKIVAKDGRTWRSYISYSEYPVLTIDGTDVIQSNCSFSDQPPESIDDREVPEIYKMQGATLKGFIVKAREILKPIFEDLPKNMEEVTRSHHTFSLEHIERPLGNLYYDAGGKPCEPFTEPDVIIYFNSIIRYREDVTSEYEAKLSSSIHLKHEELKSDCSEKEALKETSVFITFDQNKKKTGYEHNKGFVMKQYVDKPIFKIFKRSLDEDDKRFIQRHKENKQKKGQDE